MYSYYVFRWWDLYDRGLLMLIVEWLIILFRMKVSAGSTYCRSSRSWLDLIRICRRQNYEFGKDETLSSRSLLDFIYYILPRGIAQRRRRLRAIIAAVAAPNAFIL